jgi:hypothetical protein
MRNRDCTSGEDVERNETTSEERAQVGSRRRFLGRSAVAGVGLLALSGGTGAVLAAELRDQHGGTSTSPEVLPSNGASAIQALVDAAAAGGTVVVPAGTYNERVTIDKPLTLAADGDVVLDASGLGYGITIRSSDVTVRGFDLRGDAGTQTGISIVIPSGGLSGVEIEDNHISGMAGLGGAKQRQAWGILSWGDGPLSDVVIQNNRIENIGGPKGTDPEGCGICLIGVSGTSAGAGATIEGNTIRNITNGNLNNPFAPSGGLTNLIPYGVGIAIQPLDGSGSDGVLVTGNDLAAPVNVVLGNRSNPITSQVIGNNFDAKSMFGVVNAHSAASVMATCNYWGHSSGPQTLGLRRGRGVRVLGNVDYKPWAVHEYGKGSNHRNACTGGM